MRAEGVFVRRALDQLGVHPEVISAGQYKSAGEIIERDSMSPQAREALEAVVDDLYAALVGGLAEGRGVGEDVARRWIDEGPYLAEEALECGLCTALVYGDEVPKRLAALSGESGEATTIGETGYLRLSRRRFVWQPLGEGPQRIAVVPVLGLIRPGSSAPLQHGRAGMMWDQEDRASHGLSDSGVPARRR